MKTVALREALHAHRPPRYRAPAGTCIMSDELRELAKRLGNPLAAAEGAPVPEANGRVHDRRSVADEREPRSSLDRKLRAAAERSTEDPR